MPPFIHEDFLLESEPARRLYHEHAADLPIIDYHCHLPPDQIARDHRFGNLAELWLHGDHYKWRAMRSNGVDERFCTGDADDREKFDKWAETMPRLLRNPLYHWTQLELKRYFDVDELLSPTTAETIWRRAEARLSGEGCTARGLMQRSRVVCVCTTDDPIDSLEHHRALAKDEGFAVQVRPTWRPDKALAIDRPGMFRSWVQRLGAAANVEIRDYTTLLTALRKRHDFFHASGCRLSDHGLERVHAEPWLESEVAGTFKDALSARSLNPEAVDRYRSALLHEMAQWDAERGWTQQFHLGALRNNNTRAWETLGPDTGFDSIGDWPVAQPLARLLDGLERRGRLARTILYSLNPKDNHVLAAMLGNFMDGQTPGKLQLGSAWWFLDQLEGMRAQIEVLSQLGLLSRFVGMVTDSRSFLSFTRHEYFRRLLCNILGEDVVRGLIPDDMELVGRMVRDICYNNAATFFGFAGIEPVD